MLSYFSTKRGGLRRSPEAPCVLGTGQRASAQARGLGVTLRIQSWSPCSAYPRVLPFLIIPGALQFVTH